MATRAQSSLSRRRLSWLWLALGLLWFLACAVALRPDRPATALAQYCAQTGSLLSCNGNSQPSKLLLPPPSFANAKRELMFFVLLSLGTPLLVLVMARAARWAAGGTDAA